MMPKHRFLGAFHKAPSRRRRGPQIAAGPRLSVLAAFCALGMALPLMLLWAPAAAGDAAAATDATTSIHSVAPASDADRLTCEAQPYQVPYQVVVKVENMRSLDGLLTVELYNDNPDGFIKKAGRLERFRVDATRSQSELCLVAPGPGTYAVVVYHDENGNRKFDKNFLGIPIEGFGVSNNPGFSLGPPALADSSFTLDDTPVSLTISMNYL